MAYMMTVGREDVGWLAGIMDGEGYISQDKRSGGFRFGVGNTSEEIIKKVALILLAGDIFFSTYEYKTSVGRPHFVIVVCRLLDVKKICAILKPYIVRRSLLESISKVEVAIVKKNCRKNRGFSARSDRKPRQLLGR